MLLPAIENGSFWLPKQSSTFAPEVDHAWDVVMVMCIVFFIGIMGAITYFVYAYKRKSDTEKTSPIDHSTKIELIWTIIPTILVLGLFFVGVTGFINVSVAPAEAYEITVTAEKWNWTFTYPNGNVSPNLLVVPKDRPVKLIMSSRDVIHSFYVPEFRVKRDVIPGSYTTIWFEATERKDILLECAEYCGKGHSEMLGTVRVLEEPEFKKWLDDPDTGDGPPKPPAEKGEALFASWACKTCHSIDGTRGTGPSLKGVFGSQVEISFPEDKIITADENYIRESILVSNAKVVKGFTPVMPLFKGTLKDKDVDNLLAYIKTLK